LSIRVLRAVAHLRGHPAHALSPVLPAAVRAADIVHTHHLRSAPSQVAIVAGRLAGTKVTVTDHGLGRGGLPGWFPGLVHRFLPVSQYSARTLRAPASKTTVIYGGADPDRFRPEPAERRTGVLGSSASAPLATIRDPRRAAIPSCCAAWPPGAR
jgi:glycosyltransferase involved in cell wall biosynthesis